MSIDQDITNLPTPPSRSDSPSDFSDKADTFLAALPQLQTELNLYADEANSTQTEINLSETNAATSEQNAEDWASLTSGIVLSTDYSAKAYAVSEDLVPDGSAKEWAIKLGSEVDGNDFSAKKYAIDAEASASAAAVTAGAESWDSNVTYSTDDVAIGSDGNTYRSLIDNNFNNDPVLGDGTNWNNLTGVLSDEEVRSLFSAKENLSYDASTGEFSGPPLILKPTNISPADETVDTGLTPTLEASGYFSLYGVNMISSRWQLSTVPDFSSLEIDETVSGTSTTFTPSDNLSTLTTYYWRVQYKDTNENVSDFSDPTEFTTANFFIVQPSITSPSDQETDVSDTITITTTAFESFPQGSDTHESTDWQISDDSSFTNIVFESLNDTSNLESIGLSSGVLSTSTTYYVRARHTGVTFGDSFYSPVIEFTTASSFIPQGEVAKLIASDGSSGHNFGDNVSISGDYAVVGAVGVDSPSNNIGAAYIFKRNQNGDWLEHQKITGSQETSDAFFGLSASIFGDLLAIASSIERVYIYRKDSSDNWNEVDIIDRSSSGIGFGRSVAINENYLFVGAPFDDSNGISNGAAFMFENDGSDNYNQINKFTPSGASSGTGNELGRSVAIHGSYAVCGVPKSDEVDTNSGSAYVFELSSGVWSESQQLLPDLGPAGGQFGISVDLSDNYLVVGAYFDGSLGVESNGAVYVYELNSSGSWQSVQRLFPDVAQKDSKLGQSVSISNDILVAGAPQLDGPSGNAGIGAVYLYRPDSSGNWNQINKFFPSDTSTFQAFGISVSISGTFFIGGAPSDEAAYLFE